LLLDNTNIRRVLIFSLESSLCWVLADILHGMGENIAHGLPARVTFASAVFLFITDFILSLLNLLPSIIARSMVARKPMSGGGAIFASCIHYATVYLLVIIPRGFMTGSFSLGSLPMIGGVIAYIVWAALSYITAYHVVSMPPIMGDSEVDLLIPLDDSEKCLTALGDFMALLSPVIGEHRKVEKLWSEVYVYLKDLPKIRKFVINKGLRHDEIALNAVGNIAFTMLAGGELHSAFGTLSPDGEYVRKVWWIAANELAKRSYCRPEDVTRGLQALDSAIVSADVKQPPGREGGTL
jgi:hypothetical protein